MKNYSFMALSGLFLVVNCGCGWLLERNTDTNNYRKVDKLISNFLLENPKIDSNDILRRDAVLKFTEIFPRFVDTNGMSDYPMQVVSIREIDNGYGRGFVVHLVSSKVSLHSIPAKASFDFFAIVDKTTAISLRQSDKNIYVVEGCSKTQYLPDFDISSVTDDYVNSELNIIDGRLNLGCWVIHPNKIRLLRVNNL